MRRRTAWFFGILIVVVLGCPILISRVFNKPETVTVKIRYVQPGATEVFLVWGVNNWQVLPEADQPSSTLVRNGVMYTPMSRTGDVFTVDVTFASSTTINYGFLTTRTTDGAIVSLWEADDSENFNYAVLGNITREYVSALTGGDAIPIAVSTLPLVEVQIQTIQPQAGEVSLMWGVNDWRALPAPLQPAGTMVVDGIMHSPMKSNGRFFFVDLKVPAGAMLDYGFKITRKRTGEAIVLWQADGQEGFHTPVYESGVLSHDNGANLSGIVEAVSPLSPTWKLVSLLGLLTLMGIAAQRIYPDHRPRDWKQSSAFFVVCGAALAILFAVLRAHLLGFHWITWSLSWVLIPFVLAVSLYDWGYVAGLVVSFSFLSWVGRSSARAQRILVLTFASLLVVSLASTAVNVQVFHLLGKPITYPLIRCSGSFGSADSWLAMTNHTPLLFIVSLITVAASLLVFASWLERGLSGWNPPHTMRARWITGLASFGILVAYLFLARSVLAQGLWKTERLLNPVVAVAQSVAQADDCPAFTSNMQMVSASASLDAASGH